MERVQAEEVIKAVAEICRQHSVEQLVLFGSRAKGRARERDLKDSFVLSGTGAKFSITFDLAWKVMKDVLVQHYCQKIVDVYIDKFYELKAAVEGLAL